MRNVQVREYNKLGRNCLAIMLDTKGPEVRSGDLTEPIDMKNGAPLHTLLVMFVDTLYFSRLVNGVPFPM